MKVLIVMVGGVKPKMNEKQSEMAAKPDAEVIFCEQSQLCLYDSPSDFGLIVAEASPETIALAFEAKKKGDGPVEEQEEISFDETEIEEE